MAVLWKWYILYGILLALGLLSCYAVSTIDGFIYFEKDYFFKLLSFVLVVTSLLVTDFRRWTINFPDIILLCGAVYLTLNGAKTNHPHEAINHLLLFVIYFFVRQLLYIAPFTLQYFTAIYIVIALVYAGHGMLQYVGALPMTAFSPAISGNYQNPAPFAGLLAITVPFSIPFLLADKPIESRSRFESILPALAWCVALLGTAAVVLTESRAGFIALASAAVFVSITSTSLGAYLRKKQWLVTIIIITLLASVYWLRPDSANGRLLIWRIASKMVMERPITGGGEQYFRDHYMRYQGNYMSALAPEARRIYGQHVANTPYAFNEYVRMAVDDGLFGLCLFAVAVIVLLFSYRPNSKQSNPWIIGFRISLVSALVFAFFSYPLHDLTFRVLLMLVFAGISSQVVPCLELRMTKSFRVLTAIIALVFGVFALPNIRQRYEAYQIWRELRQSPHDASAFVPLAATIHEEGLFAIDYAVALGRNKQFSAAVATLNQSLSYSSNPTIHLHLGKYYGAIGQYDSAQTNYRSVSDMLPYKFYPLYCMMFLHARHGKEADAIKVANEILAMPVKVHSRTVDLITETARQYLTKSTSSNERLFDLPINNSIPL